MALDNNPTTDPYNGCNRIPFLSDDSCDRGQVDTHKFDELPYCEPISPDLPRSRIPPQVVDKSIDMEIPPPCNCIEIEGGKINVAKMGAAGDIKFRAKGDCCTGVYEMNLSIPCILGDKGSRDGSSSSSGGGGSPDKKIKISLGYGSSSSAISTQTYATVNKESCELDLKQVKFDLKIPCPIPAANKDAQITLSWKNKPQDRQAIVKKGEGSCDLDTSLVNFDLGLPCPIPNTDKKAKISIDWKDKKSDEQTIVKKNSSCGIDISTVNFDLGLPCPIPNTDKKAKITLGWKDKKEDEQTIVKKNGSCGIDTSLTTFNLGLPCPVPKPTKKPKIKASVAYGDSAQSASPSYASYSSCEIKLKDVDLDLKLPCPIKKGDSSERKLKVSVRFAKPGDSWSNEDEESYTGRGDVKKAVNGIPSPRDSVSLKSVGNDDDNVYSRDVINVYISNAQPFDGNIGISPDPSMAGDTISTQHFYSGLTIYAFPVPNKYANLSIAHFGHMYGDDNEFVTRTVHSQDAGQVLSITLSQQDYDEYRQAGSMYITSNFTTKPIKPGGKGDGRTVSATADFAYIGNEPSARDLKKRDAEDEECELSLKNMDIDLTLPCPVRKYDKGEEGYPKIRIRYNKSSTEESLTSASYVEIDSSTCEARFKTVELGLPCPVKSGEGDGKPKIRIRYMKSNTVSAVVSASYAEIKSGSCAAEFKTIELDLRDIAGGGGGGGGGDEPFYPVIDDSSDSSSSPSPITIREGYWQYGGITYRLDDTTIPAGTGFLSLRAGTTPRTAGTASLQLYPDLGALNAAQHDPQYFIIPLFYILNGRVTLDLRRMPIVFAAEVF